MEKEKHMKNYDLIIFDLDGTLIDTGIGIMKAVEYALDKFNIPVGDYSTLRKFIGPPLKASFMKYYNFTEEDAEKAILYYREYYKDKGLYENKIYDGMDELLSKIKESGRKLVVATSKPEVFAKIILDQNNISKYFHIIGGATLDGSRINKDDVIRYALDNLGSHDKTTALMIGDTEFDIYGAKKVGIDSLGITYGYGQEEEIKKAGATYIKSSVKEIEDIIF